MGVTGLETIINAFAENSIKYRQFQNYRGTCQPLDTSVIICRFCKGILDIDSFRSFSNEFTGHLFACVTKSLQMLNYGIKPIWVLDGPPPRKKKKTLTKRKNARNVAILKLNENNLTIEETNKLNKKAFNVTSKHFNEIKYLLTLMGLPFIESPGEAEAQCAALNIAGISKGVVTDDWDVILFGCKSMLKNFSNKSHVVEIDIVELMKTLEITREQFITLGGILGNDYGDGIKGLKPIDAYIKFKECGFDIDKLLVTLRHDKQYRIPDNFKEQLKLSRDYYLHAPVIDPKDIKIIWNVPNYDKLYDYLVLDKNFKSKFINAKLKELKMMYDQYIINGKLITLNRIKKERIDLTN